MVTFPHGKINLGLNVIAKRNDGFHTLETCFYPVPVTDILEIIPSKDFLFSQSGIMASAIAQENLCVMAFNLLKKDFGFGEVKIHLHKVIPMGAGLGGGSSDAAFTLHLLNQIFNLKISIEVLKNYAAQLGSDCSFFLENLPMIGTGRGEILSPTPVRLKNYFLVLVKPDIHSSTAHAYASITPKKTEHSLEEILNLPVKEWRNKLINDFEKSIFENFPLINRIKDKMYSFGAIYSSMSGSGSAVFGIFEKGIDLKSNFADMFYWSGELK